MMLAMADTSRGEGAAWTRATVPYAATEVVVAAMEKRRATGQWPSRDEIPLPAGAASLALTESTNGRVTFVLRKSDGAILFRGDLAPDGTLSTAMPAEVIAEVLRKATAR